MRRYVSATCSAPIAYVIPRISPSQSSTSLRFTTWYSLTIVLLAHAGLPTPMWYIEHLSPGTRNRLVLVAAILGSVIVFVDGSVVNVALPAIQRSLGGGLALQQWVVDAYLLTLGSLLLVGGSLGDLFGPRRVFLLGIVAFGLTSILCAAAPDGTTLILARGLQGMAGAVLTPAGLAVITWTFQGEERGAAVGSWTAWTGIAFVLGPLVGG